MTAVAEAPEPTPKKGLKGPMIIGLLLALIGGGGGFFAVKAGILGQGSAEQEVVKTHQKKESKPLDVSFIAIDPLVMSLPGDGGRDHLRFAAQLEVPPNFVAEVEAIKPRIVDVLNGYLRAVDIAELEDPTALVRLRAQMLRRVQVVAGEGRIHDILIMEFVLN
ncbi:flagellar basal body-associated protein FliL [Yoonia sp.]|uniref:flagellar basal body-associated FliL family protein n=1 Tax=Yoonia sp. TaxID=2212373 RepID=UPI0019DD2354|nr:flagellar basal body-associated FliL family protein [Yoonia sp.]MBE0413795.1 flagellar basal body-associated FliL family protein [Yoonia sp.]